MKEQTIMAVVALQRKLLVAITEFAETTQELAGAVERRDQRAVRTLIIQRQESLEAMQENRELTLQTIDTLPYAQSQQLRRLLAGTPLRDDPRPETLVKLIEQNKRLLERAKAADEAVNRKMGGAKSFYERT